jgi:DNA-binding XRE family transcriptional regulator
MEEPMNGSDFRKIRKAARMTQAQMADRLDVSRKTIVNWENDVFAIPDDALDTLTEKGVAALPEAPKPISVKTHPGLYNYDLGPKYPYRNHKHPHWWTRALSNWMTEAQKQVAGAIVTTTNDVETIVWTPERAIVFTMAFLQKTRTEATNICRDCGFDIPRDPESAFIRASNDWLSRFGSMAGFYEAHPEFERPQSETSPEELEKSLALQKALDEAFKL